MLEENIGFDLDFRNKFLKELMVGIYFPSYGVSRNCKLRIMQFRDLFLFVSETSIIFAFRHDETLRIL